MTDGDDGGRDYPELTLTESKLAYPTHVVPGREQTHCADPPEDADGGGLGFDLVPVDRDEADQAGESR